MILSRTARLVLAIVAVVDMMLFSSGDSLSLLGFSVGMAVIVLGILYYYRPAAIAGLFIVSLVAAVTTDVPTLTEIGYLVMALLGLIAPIGALIWVCFTEEEENLLRVSFRPALPAVTYALACLWSVPVAVVVLGLLAPAVSAGLTVMTEMGIVLLTATTLGIAFTFRGTEAARHAEAAQGESAGGGDSD